MEKPHRQPPPSPLEHTISTSLKLARLDFEHRRSTKSSLFNSSQQNSQQYSCLLSSSSSSLPELPTSPLRLSRPTNNQEDTPSSSNHRLPETNTTTTATTTTNNTPPSWIVHQVAQLEAHIRKLRRENQEWTARFRGEARSRSTVLDMQRTMQGIDHDRQSAEHALEQAHLNLEHADRRARKAVHDAEQWKQLADRKTLSELEQSQIEDMLWKPKYDKVTNLWTVLTDDHDKLRNAFENLFENYLDVTSKAARKFRPKMTKAQLDATADKLAGKKKKKSGTRPPPKKKKGNDKKKKKGKFGPELVKQAVKDRREEFIKTRRKKMSVHVADIIHSHSHQARHHNSHASGIAADGYTNLTPDWANKGKGGEDHLLQVLSCPSTQHSVVPHPWAKYLKPAPDIIRVAYVDYDRLMDLLEIVYRAAMTQKFGGDIDPSEDGIDEVGTYTGRMRLLSDLFREQLTLKYGLQSVVEGYLYGVAESIVKYAPENLHIEFFGRMVGVVDPDLYSARMGAMFFRMLRTVCDSEQAIILLTGIDSRNNSSSSSSSTSESKTSRTSKGNGKDGDEVEEAVNEESKTLVTIPLARALQAVETIFPSKPDYMLAWAKKELHPDLKEKIIKTLRRLSVPDAKSMVLDVNLLLICSVDVWLEQHETDLYALCKLFRDRRIKEDKPLDYRVFATAARSCRKDPMPQFPDSILFPMFEQVLCTKDTSMDVCSRDGFAVVCCAWGIVPPFIPEEVKAGEVDKKKK